MNSPAFEKLRDEKLRKGLLTVLNIARGFSPTGGLSGNRLHAETIVGVSEDMSFTDDNHFLRLCRDLVNHGLVSQKDLGNRRKSESFAPRHVAYSITALGTQLVEEKIPPVAGIEDERIVEGT